ncbi:MAG: hypothetical protein IJX13_01535 [Clostridia bacterium]|nr:hypothetical protein [Clostridia bacterium]
MKVLIAYASKNGTVADCARRLEAQLKNIDVTLADLSLESLDASQYDLVITGSSVRFGKLLKAEKAFLQEQKAALLQRPLALFLCCGYAHEYEYYREKLFPEELTLHAYQSLYFGGSLKKEGLGFFEKMVVRAMRSSIIESEIDDGEYTPSLPAILPENIEILATYTRLEIAKLLNK